MQFPQFFSSSGNLLKKLFRPAGGGTFVIAAMLALTTFIIGFLVSLPEQALRKRLEYELNRNLPADIKLRQAGYSFPFAIAANGVRIRPHMPNTPLLTFDSVTISPALSTLFGEPAANFSVLAGRGTMTGTITATGDLVLDINDYDIDEAIPNFNQLRLSADIRSAHIETDLTPENDSPTNVNIRSENLRIAGLAALGFSSDRIDLGSLDLLVDGTGNNLSIEKGSLTGGAISAEATGRIVTGRTLLSTRVNLVLELHSAADLDPTFSSMLELLGPADPDGSRKLKLRGTLARLNRY